ncbi:MAG TPA: hypothetical protein VKX17_05295 [Planctomycetota bacterium]|nr:hypothetical protein [Planctomycetota bacterium]
MNMTIEVELPELLAQEAKACGLLESRRLAELLNKALRRDRARKEFGQMLGALHSLPGEPMTPEETQNEIDAARAARKKA